MGRKCNVLDCPSDSKRVEDTGVTYHKMPLNNDLRPKWMELCRIPDERLYQKVIYVCSRHFRRTDFCSSKGGKYVLRPGTLPSVFPWSKINLKTNVAETPETINDPELKPDSVVIKEEPNWDESTEKSITVKSDDLLMMDSIKTEIKEEPGFDTTRSINFLPDTLIEANDFNDKWYPAKILEVDYDENEVFVEFSKNLNRANEWIPMDSSRLRPVKPRPNVTEYTLGERCMATWVDSCNKYPATINRVLGDDVYEVLFDDGYTKVLTHRKISKLKHSHNLDPAVLHGSPLFDPVVGSKEDRRERKRKLNVAELFGPMRKKPKSDEASLKHEYIKDEELSAQEENSVPIAGTSTGTECEGEEWTCKWSNGEPVGVESVLESVEGPRRSIIVADHRLPPGWEKHFTQRMYGHSAGKWDTILVNPDGRKFHSKHSIKSYLEDNKLDYNIDQFDFCLHLNRARKLGLYEITSHDGAIKLKNKSKGTPKSHINNRHSSSSRFRPLTPKLEEKDDSNSLKILMENNSYICPIEGCGKQFRKENLAQMHIKHYHPKFSKLIGSTPNVADLAYARTVGEAIDEFQPKPRTSHSPYVNTPANVFKPKIKAEPKQENSEIIKLLNSEPKTKFDSIFESQELKSEEIATPQDKYPEIKLRDLLNKAEPIPDRPAGIKTLLPVIRTTEPQDDLDLMIQSHSLVKIQDKPKGTPGRKRQLSENRKHPISYESPEVDYYQETSAESILLEPKQEILTTPNIIVEEGEVIRLVHMKSEEIVNCTCGITEEDGLMIQCELCLCWQHGHCNNILRENQVPDKYICYICKNPLLMRASQKFYHDQDWLKKGCLPTANYHSKDEDKLKERFEILRKSHELSACLIESRDFLHNLKIKLNISKNIDHPKLYLWAKPWDKTIPLDDEPTPAEDLYQDHEYLKNTPTTTFGVLNMKSMLAPSQDDEIKPDLNLNAKIQSQVELISILEDDTIKSDFPKIDLNEMIEKSEQKDTDLLTMMDDKAEKNTDLMDLNEIIDKNQEEKGQDMLIAESKANELNEVTEGILSSTSLELTLTQSDLERLSSLVEQETRANAAAAAPAAPCIPQPEAAIDPADCRMNLLEHVAHYQNIAEERLDKIEAELNELDSDYDPKEDENEEDEAKLKQTLQMLIKDLSTLRQIAALPH